MSSSSKTILDVKHQPLGILIAGHAECAICRFADQDMSRTRGPIYFCKICNKETQKPPRQHFPPNVLSLIDLIQKTYHAETHHAEETFLWRANHTSSAKDISIVLFFCVLKESLLKHVIRELMLAHQVPRHIRKRLLEDNKLHKQKQGKLFKTLTETTWKSAIRTINNKIKADFLAIDNFVGEVSSIRNKFLHEGEDFSIDEGTATACLENIHGLIKLHVLLHNTYVHPHYIPRDQGTG